MRLRDIFKELNLEYYQSNIEPLEYPVPSENNKIEFQNNVIYETNKFNDKKKLEPKYTTGYFKYFLDGSRKVYKLGDLITTNKKYVPVIGAQIAVGACSRDEQGYMSKCRLEKNNILCLYSEISEEDITDIREAISEELFKRGNEKIEILKYKVDKFQEDMPQNAGIAKIHKAMQDLEIKMLTEIAQEDINVNEDLIILDGSLQFISQKFDIEIFNNVIGVSKSFNTSKTNLLKKRAQIGSHLSKLEFGERTPVFKIELDNGRYSIGSWYLRIRKKRHCNHSLEGIIKIEKMAVNEEIEEGLDSYFVDEISSHLLAEINPSCHGKDSRWANHLYPIYCTEKMVKTSFISDKCFENLF